MAYKIRGLKLPHFKDTANIESAAMPCPQSVAIPMAMHIGAPAVPAVKAGEQVCVGQLIGRAEGRLSSPVYASISGTVKKIENRLSGYQNNTETVIIESDGLMTTSPDIRPPAVTDYSSFIDTVFQSGVVGLGGAGFPTYAKLDVKDISRIKHIVINGAECEPFITSDTKTMVDRAELIESGCRLLNRFLGAEDIIIAIEDNNRACTEKMSAISEKLPYVRVKKLKAVYPQGGEKVLVYNTVSEVVPEGKLPIDVGVVVINCSTLAAIAEYIETGMPLVCKCVTVDGSAVKNPQNVIAPIGTSVSDIIDFCGGFRSEAGKILFGGPMMGIAAYSLDMPVLKNTNAILALDKKDAELGHESDCIRCGRCVRICPFGLNPPAIAKAYALNDFSELERLHAMQCMECGCCSYVCPARKPIVQKNKLAKAALRRHMQDKK